MDWSWLCKIGFHWCEYAKIPPQYPPGYKGPPAWCVPLVAERMAEAFGGVHLRRCKRCGILQQAFLDTRGCYSITDPPGYIWKEIKQPNTSDQIWEEWIEKGEK